MAGDWIKAEAATPDKPEVMEIAMLLGFDDPDMAFGKLFRLWRWFDEHSSDGNARGVTFALLNRLIGVSGFAEAVESVGWLTKTDDGISLPNFDFHNGKTAKLRAQTAKRVAKHKTNANGNADSVSEALANALPREEKRREEDKEPAAPIPLKPKRQKQTPLPEGFGISERVQAWAEEKGHRNLSARLEHFVSYAKRSGKMYADWDEAFMGAIREDWAKLSSAAFQQGAAPTSVVKEWSV